MYLFELENVLINVQEWDPWTYGSSIFSFFEETPIEVIPVYMEYGFPIEVAPAYMEYGFHNGTFACGYDTDPKNRRPRKRAPLVLFGAVM